MALSSTACPLESIFFRNSSARMDIGAILGVVGDTSGVPRSRFETAHSLTHP